MIFPLRSPLPVRLSLRPGLLAASAALALALGMALPAAAHPPKAPQSTGAAGHDGAMKDMEGMKDMPGMMNGMKGMEGMEEHEHGNEQFTFGHPSPEAKPDRIIHITAMDTMRFDPPMITVKPGSVIKFEVTNKGEIPHSWSIDTKAEQVEHEEGMEDMPMENMMGHMDGEPNGFVLKPGETKTLTWTFTKGGDIQYACHLPGHYGAGMHGELKVEGAAAHHADHAAKTAHGHEQAQSHEHEAH